VVPCVIRPGVTSARAMAESLLVNMPEEWRGWIDPCFSTADDDVKLAAVVVFLGEVDGKRRGRRREWKWTAQYEQDPGIPVIL
jgi:hypothetical protein